jgi:hypothetical protein
VRSSSSFKEKLRWRREDLPRDAIKVGKSRTRQECGRPRPRTNDTSHDQTRFDASRRSIEFLGLFGREVGIPILEVSSTHHYKRKDSSNSNQDSIAYTRTQDLEWCPYNAVC